MLHYRFSFFSTISLCTLLLLCLSGNPAQAQTPLPAPQQVLGFKPGTERTVADWTQIRNYFQQLDRASDRVQLQDIGRTTLGRPMFVAIISAPENIRDLARYREIQKQLADPRLVENSAARDKLLETGKTVVAISCSIHANEIVASQMSMQLAYELAAGNDAATRETLANTILILIPSANPDGLDIVADWYRKTLNTPYEGTIPPELYHHYAGHDNNRDWFMLNLAETKNITRLFWREWYPQIVYDVHQMGSDGARFCLPPFHEPANPSIPPRIVRATGALGYEMASALQNANYQGVITNAMFDMWWHGGFRSAPYFHNSIGILSEAASAKLMTPYQVTETALGKFKSRGIDSALTATLNFPDPWAGGAWGPRDIMAMEMTAARALLTRAAKYRRQYLSEFYEQGRYNVQTRNADARHPLAYFIPPGQGREEEIAKLIGLLIEQGVEVYRFDKEFHPRSTQPEFYQAEVPAGTYIIYLAQPQRYNVQALFEIQRYPNRIGADGKAERPYDVTGWTLPQMMGVEAFALTGINEKPEALRQTLVRDPLAVRRDFGLPMSNDPTRSPIANPLGANQPRIGLYRSWTNSMDEGWTRYVFDTFNVKYTTLRDADFRGQQTAGSRQLESGQSSVGSGQQKVGSFEFSVLSFQSQSMETPHLLRNAKNSEPETENSKLKTQNLEPEAESSKLKTQNLKLKAENSKLKTASLRDRFDVIILPSMRADDILNGNKTDEYPAQYTGGMTTAGAENLRQFVNAGGKLVVWDDAAEFAIEQFKLPLRETTAGVSSAKFYCPGSILRVNQMNPNAPDAKPQPTDVYFINSTAFEATDAAKVKVHSVYADKDSLLRSGWLLGPEYLAGKIAQAEVSYGQGKIILFAYRPQHRGQMWGTFPLIFDALR